MTLFPKCGVNNVVTAVTTTPTGGSFQCTFRDGPTSPSVDIQVADFDGDFSTISSVVVSVNNVV